MSLYVDKNSFCAAQRLIMLCAISKGVSEEKMRKDIYNGIREKEETKQKKKSRWKKYLNIIRKPKPKEIISYIYDYM